MRRLLALFGILYAVGAEGEERMLPSPRTVIYPGDQIGGQMLEEVPVSLSVEMESQVAQTKDAIIGKVARRTLLPGQAIPLYAIDAPRVVAVGAQVKIVFKEGGMQIVAYGVAQQPGGVGDFIRVRNQDSGLFVTGRVQPDGSVRVSDG